jgi:hypothetical protein
MQTQKFKTVSLSARHWGAMDNSERQELAKGRIITFDLGR